MGKLLNVLSFVVLFCCLEPTPLADVTVHEQLSPLVNEYVKTLGVICPKYKMPTQVTIGFGVPRNNEDWVGLCHQVGNVKQIYIDPQYWFDPERETHRRVLMFHELGHCLLGLEHSSDPYNYMYKSVIITPDFIVNIQVRQDMKRVCGQ